MFIQALLYIFINGVLFYCFTCTLSEKVSKHFKLNIELVKFISLIIYYMINSYMYN